MHLLTYTPITLLYCAIAVYIPIIAVSGYVSYVILLWSSGLSWLIKRILLLYYYYLCVCVHVVEWKSPVGCSSSWRSVMWTRGQWLADHWHYHRCSQVSSQASQPSKCTEWRWGQCQCQCQSEFFSVAKIAELLQSPHGRNILAESQYDFREW